MTKKFVQDEQGNKFFIGVGCPIEDCEDGRIIHIGGNRNIGELVVACDTCGTQVKSYTPEILQ